MSDLEVVDARRLMVRDGMGTYQPLFALAPHEPNQQAIATPVGLRPQQEPLIQVNKPALANFTRQTGMQLYLKPDLPTKDVAPRELVTQFDYDDEDESSSEFSEGGGPMMMAMLSPSRPGSSGAQPDDWSVQALCHTNTKWLIVVSEQQSYDTRAYQYAIFLMEHITGIESVTTAGPHTFSYRIPKLFWDRRKDLEVEVRAALLKAYAFLKQLRAGENPK